MMLAASTSPHRTRSSMVYLEKLLIYRALVIHSGLQRVHETLEGAIELLRAFEVREMRCAFDDPEPRAADLAMHQLGVPRGCQPIFAPYENRRGHQNPFEEPGLIDAICHSP